MKVLVLSLSTGGGHNSVSKALVDYINSHGHEAKMVDAYEYINPMLSTLVSKGYLVSTKHAPNTYSKFYRYFETHESFDKKFTVRQGINKIMSIPFSTCVTDYNPDCIVCTHVLAVALLECMEEELLEGIKIFGVITDYTVHPVWEDTYIDYYVTASELLNLQMHKKRLPLERILPLGIPIKEKFSHKIPEKEAKKLLGIPDKPTVLIMSGSMGFGNLVDHITKLDTLDMEFQMLIVCGNNKRLKKRVENLHTEKSKFVYGFVDNVDVLMDASECIVTKPGGLTVSEAMAKNLPMILFNPIPGQEYRNLEFLVNNGLAQAVSDTYPIDEAVFQLLLNKWRRNNIREAISDMAKPNATKDLCEFIFTLDK